ncbi:MAG TPA: translation initiation factor IF-3, partial [Chryseobacterium indologenes]|nr:translation initiation factor IF-3 [Chryseobacterium indologenes]
MAQRFNNRGPQRRPVQEDAHLINDKIRVRELRLVGDNVE